jgi:uncharacterized protein YggE
MDIITRRMAMGKVFGVLCALVLLSVSAHAETSVRLISVNGKAEKSFQPDIIRLSVSVWGKGDSAKKAQANNQGQYDLLKKSVEQFGIQKEDIRTTSYDLNPDYFYNPKTNKNSITGYTANQGLNITLRKIEDAGKFIDSLTTDSKTLTSGINIGNFAFDLDKRKQEEEALLKEAVKLAEGKAEVLASAARVKLKGVYHLTPQDMAMQPMYMQAMELGKAKGGSNATQLMSGEIKIEASVSADYIIE